MAICALRHLLETSKAQVPSPQCDTGVREQAAKFPLFLPEQLQSSEDVFSSGEFVFHSNLCLEEKAFFFVRYLNLYKNVRKQYGECILNFIAWDRASPSLYSKK